MYEAPALQKVAPVGEMLVGFEPSSQLTPNPAWNDDETTIPTDRDS